MPLSEYEQRVLDQLERDLGADPKLGRTMSKGPRQRGRIAIGGLGVVVGLAVVLAGVSFNVIPLGIAGFALMIAAAMWALLSPRKSTARAGKASNGTRQAAGKGSRKQPFMRRVEERLERRREQGDL